MPTTLLVGVFAAVTAAPPRWQVLERGVEYATFTLVSKPTAGDGLLHVVRIDPNQVELRAVLASEQQVPLRTAGDWAEGLGLSVAINAGMFQTDYQSNVGYLRNGTHANNRNWSTKYLSVLAFGAKRPGLPSAVLLDLDAPGAREALADYHTVIQNLRLIRGEGQNVWKPGRRQWSEAAIGIDRSGRILFLFSRTPFSMNSLNERLLKLPLEITRAMHVEGGPEASLSIRTKGLSVDLSGSFETGFNETEESRRQWPIPNVVGVVPGIRHREESRR